LRDNRIPIHQFFLFLLEHLTALVEDSATTLSEFAI
jgi:hypothetical protein